MELHQHAALDCQAPVRYLKAGDRRADMKLLVLFNNTRGVHLSTLNSTMELVLTILIGDLTVSIVVRRHRAQLFGSRRLLQLNCL